jgi:hypothetical protein
LKAVHHILVSSAESRRAFNSDFDTGSLHRPTSHACTVTLSRVYRRTLQLKAKLKAAHQVLISSADCRRHARCQLGFETVNLHRSSHVESGSSHFSFKRCNQARFKLGVLIL